MSARSERSFASRGDTPRLGQPTGRGLDTGTLRPAYPPSNLYGVPSDLDGHQQENPNGLHHSRAFCSCRLQRRRRF